MSKASNKYYKSIISEFLKDKNYSNDQYESISKIYMDIRDYYCNKLKEDSNFNIKVEKLRLERNFGKHTSGLTNFNIAFYIAFGSALIIILLQELIKTFTSNYKYAGVIGIAIIMISFVLMFIRESNKTNPKEVMILISLNVLEDIEKEINENKAREEKKVNREKAIEEFKQHIDGNNVMKNTIIPTMIEIAATTVVRKSVIGKLLGKLKRK